MFVITVCSCFIYCFFFFKQKTAYEMRISDWSSDVCSSDLFMALTTARLDGAECLDLGLASHYLPSNALSGVKAAIASQPHYIDQLLRTSDVVAPPARIERNRPPNARLFASDRLEDILAALEDDGSEWAAIGRESGRERGGQDG